MIAPFLVFLTSEVDTSDSCLVTGGLELWGKGEGSEEADVRPGVFRRPRGSFRLALDMRSTDPTGMSAKKW